MTATRTTLILLAVWLSQTLPAQTAHGPSITDTALPNAPGRSVSNDQLQEPQGTGSIAGLVMDINGGLVPGAKITLLEHGRTDERIVTSAIDGRFSFSDLAPGRFKLTITAPGLETFVSSEINLRSGEHHELPRIDLPIAATSTDVNVVVTQTELAEEQVKSELKQRAFGIFPNFYSSYIWDAAPLSSKQKFELATRSITDPVTFLLVGAASGVEQARDTFPGYGQGAKGYAKRYGAGYADDAIARMLGSAVLPSLLHQDPRYFYRGTGSIKTRAVYAIRSAFITKADNGHWQPNYSYVGGAFGAGGISNLYHSSGDRGVGLTFRNGGLNLAGHAADNLLREFLLRKITPKIPDYENGKPE
jgi:hypothetical protein